MCLSRFVHLILSSYIKYYFQSNSKDGDLQDEVEQQINCKPDSSERNESPHVITVKVCWFCSGVKLLSKVRRFSGSSLLSLVEHFMKLKNKHYSLTSC